MVEHKYEIGMIGLGVMGRNLLLNMADHGYSVIGYDKDLSTVQALRAEAEHRDIRGAESPEEFTSLLRSPRAVMMLVPAGPVVDAVIQGVLPHLEARDLIIDGGNSYFQDTDLRAKTLAAKGILYLGVGISGGEWGARYGPSMMPGGPVDAYERVRPLFEAVAAHVNGDPCVTYLGPGSAGHYVKMVHNGIEYGLMQLLAETYDLMKRGLGLNDDELHAVYDRWNQTELNAYLVEITAQIFCKMDELTDRRLIDVILDEAMQKGTGRWTSQDAMELQVPVPTIDAAVAMRNLSAFKREREEAGQLIEGPSPGYQGERETFLSQLRNAFYAAMIITYAQGMAQLRQASQAYDYHLKLEDVARIWRGGCIIRAALLEPIRAAYHTHPDLPNLLVDPHLSREVMARQADLRAVVRTAAELGLPAPGLMASLAYFDGYRSAWLPANLIQAQRDYFGAHTYERVDATGLFHTQWRQE
ncbi:MAG: NADP-dependent phosphogluconate dehydrogenase [Ardenticatenaceae bacterium]|nr:NADP-dependent phosphogluconate dehydrogenase [Ardenticatenaceae bacterium]HBY94230.1 phosphogluconate dehydrogenase (NADP(+)-dependent, decarboxylating) [Chloroflexota bacterium]